MNESIKERPILFSAPMVQAILEGRKAQTRRVVKKQPSDGFSPNVGFYNPTVIDKDGDLFPGPEIFGASDADEGRKSSYGMPLDKLWVRETFMYSLRGNDTEKGYEDGIEYRADGTFKQIDFPKPIIKDDYKWRPSIHMPRWASRILLEITDIRVERLQDMSCMDAESEGLRPRLTEGSALCQFPPLWDSLNASRGFSWNDNPWVWVVEFKRVTNG